MQIGCGVIYKDDKILLVKKAYGTYKDKWEFPGGKRDPIDKSIQECLKRELLEELNCQTKVHELIYFMKIKKVETGLTKDLNLYFYNIQLLTDKITLSKEHTEYKWVTFIEARNMDLIKWDFRLISYFEDYFTEVSRPDISPDLQEKDEINFDIMLQGLID